MKLIRVRTEIGNQNSRTFPGLFTFFQESFFIDSDSPNTAYTQDFCPIQDPNTAYTQDFCPIQDPNTAYTQDFCPIQDPKRISL